MSGRFSGIVTTFFVDRELVQSWLPQGLRLAEESPFQDHPVVILFGTQTELTRQKLFTFKPLYGRYYLETFIAVPYLEVEQRPDAGPVFHFVRVYVNNIRARNQGIRRFGWAKIYTPICTTGRSYQIGCNGCGTLFEARTDCGRPKPFDPNNDSLKQIQDMLSQPLVLKYRGCFDLYSFDLHFGTATVRPVSVEVQLHEGFMPGLGPMEATIPGIDEADFGAFSIDCWFTKVPKD